MSNVRLIRKVVLVGLETVLVVKKLGNLVL